MSSYFVRLISPVETSLLTESLRNGPREGCVPIVTNGGMMVVFINGFPIQFLTPIGELLNLALTD
ncbi:MAG: hypothetical protein VX777_04720 [Chlamydiota bacterium]|nr:hypothetical protein [Chlamydiota bacterium]